MTDLVQAERLIQSGILSIEDGNHGEYRPRPDEFVEKGGTAFVRAADLSGGVIDFSGAGSISQIALSRIRKGIGRPLDVLLSHKGTVGKVAQAPEGCPPFVCSPQTTFWRSLDARMLDPRFLRFALEAPAFVAQLEAIKSESDMAPYVSLTQQRLLRIPFPEIGAQRAIAAVLSALDDKIAANSKLATTARELVSARFAAALSDGARRRGKFFDFFEVEYGAPFGGSLFTESGEGRPLIRIRDLKTFAPQVWSTEVRRDELVVHPGDILVGMDAEFAPTPWLGEQGVLNQRVCRVMTEYSREFTLEAVRGPVRFIEGHKSGTTVIHLNKRDLTETPVEIPGEDAARRFDADVAGVLDLVVSASAENRHLAAIRGAILPGLMSGRLTVRDAEVAVESAVGGGAVESESPANGTLW